MELDKEEVCLHHAKQKTGGWLPTQTILRAVQDRRVDRWVLGEKEENKIEAGGRASVCSSLEWG